GLSTLLMPGLSYAVLRSDNRIDPSHGYSVNLSTQVAKQGLMSDTNLLHGDIQFKALKTLWDKHRFLGRIEFGGSATNGYKS
ncbi:outer membrane protein assembly factor, partial [Pseudomonas sp. FSL R10-0071]|nr:outer membrane protein assembly factor [Pseudomonas sp. FSL R10-0071]